LIRIENRRRHDFHPSRDGHFRASGAEPMNRPLLVLLEGANDVEFLMRIASRLHQELPTIPDLSHLQQTGRIVLVPLGGGDPAAWPDRLRPLELPEFHLYDREQQPETDVRQ